MRRSAPGWSLLLLALLALILVPFFLFETALLDLAERLLQTGRSQLATAVAVFVLMLADVVLPVPSSVVATASGMLMGLLPGAFVTWAGMQAGALLGYVLGSSAGVPVAVRLVGQEGLDRASRLQRRWGAWSLIAARAVPVLAESSVVLAGITRMRLGRFAWLTGVSNAAISLVYAFVGARALETGAFLFAFVGSIAIPGVLIGIHRWLERPTAGAADPGREVMQ